MKLTYNISQLMATPADDWPDELLANVVISLGILRDNCGFVQWSRHALNDTDVAALSVLEHRRQIHYSIDGDAVVVALGAA